MSIKKIIEDLYLTDFAPVSPGADQAVERFRQELDFKVHQFPSGLEKNGWLIPESWNYTRAEILRDGKTIYNGRHHPMGVVGYSPPFKGVVDREELRKHLYFSQEQPEALVFHCTHFFRPLERDWGFCVPKSFYDNLLDGHYEVVIEAESKPGTMKVLEYTLKGTSTDTILFHGHNCHPGQANDDLSGCAVGIELLKQLSDLPNRRFTYTLLISPELFGTFYWLDSLSEKTVQTLKYAVMLKSVGNKADIKLQHSYFGDTFIDLAARNAVRTHCPQFTEGAFRRVYGNDETLFEAPGYEIPTISLTRYPFPEYHTSLDTPDTIEESTLEETVAILRQIVFCMEENVLLQRHFKGLLALSNPRYNLYQPYWNPAEKAGPKRGEQTDWHYLMIDMFRDFEKNISLLEIAERHRLPFPEVHHYLSKLKATGAISFSAVTPDPVVQYKKEQTYV